MDRRVEHWGSLRVVVVLIVRVQSELIAWIAMGGLVRWIITIQCATIAFDTLVALRASIHGVLVALSALIALIAWTKLIYLIAWIELIVLIA